MEVHSTRPYSLRSSPQGYFIPDILDDIKGNDSADRTTTSSQFAEIALRCVKMLHSWINRSLVAMLPSRASSLSRLQSDASQLHACRLFAIQSEQEIQTMHSIIQYQYTTSPSAYAPFQASRHVPH